MERSADPDWTADLRGHDRVHAPADGLSHLHPGQEVHRRSCSAEGDRRDAPGAILPAEGTRRLPRVRSRILHVLVLRCTAAGVPAAVPGALLLRRGLCADGILLVSG